MPTPNHPADTTDPTTLGQLHAAQHLSPPPPAPKPSRLPRNLTVAAVALTLLLTAGWFLARHWLDAAVRRSLPQIDGQLTLPGLVAPVTVARDTHGIPHIRAASLDDLILAQGYITAGDRLWQMETLRRHAAGTLAEILGAALVPHDRTERILGLRAAADRAIAVLPPDQLHWLDLYARGVNASIADQSSHLPVEFRVLRFTPAPWTPRDSLLVSLAMFQDLSNSFPDTFAREAIAAKLPPDLLADLYPVGSWRDHPAVEPVVDLTLPQPEIEQIPLDESQTRLRPPSHAPPSTSPVILSAAKNPRILPVAPQDLTFPDHIAALLAAAPALTPTCDSCRAGSNNWVVAGSRTASGKPLLANDMHLNHGVPGIWYEADLAASSPDGTFHVAGVTLPGAPFVIVGHNDHVAWGFTNLGAEVQDLTLEHLRGSGSTSEFQAADGTWQPVIPRQEIIHVHAGRDLTLTVPEVHHGGRPAPIISALYPGEARPISLQWTIYDPAVLSAPFFAINSAATGTALAAAFSTFGGPAQNMVYADDAGHIGYHAVGKIPVRGDPTHPTPIPPLPQPAGIAANEWAPAAPYIPYEAMPQVADPPGGILATANARVVPDTFPFPITLDWAAPYRNERIWKVLSTRTGLTPADMLTLQTDVYSDLDHAIAQRLAYAIDHASLKPGSQAKRLHQAADLLRDWTGNVDASAAEPAIVDAARAALWPLLLTPKLGADTAKLYTWGEKPFAEEQLIMHAPARWLPPGYASWDDLLADAVSKGLDADHAPSDLAKWQYGTTHPLDIEHPVLSGSPILHRLLGYPTGTGSRPQSGDGSTVKQVGRAFGPSERFTADLANPDASTLNLVLGESGDAASPWFMDQFDAWYTGRTFPLPYTDAAVRAATTHTLTLTPQ